MENIKQVLDLTKDYDEVQKAQLIAAIIFSPETTVNESANILAIQNILFAAVSDMTKNNAKFTYTTTKQQMDKFFSFTKERLGIVDTKEVIEHMLHYVVVIHEKTH